MNGERRVAVRRGADHRPVAAVANLDQVGNTTAARLVHARTRELINLRERQLVVAPIRGRFFGTRLTVGDETDHVNLRGGKATAVISGRWFRRGAQLRALKAGAIRYNDRPLEPGRSVMLRPSDKIEVLTGATGPQEWRYFQGSPLGAAPVRHPVRPPVHPRPAPGPRGGPADRVDVGKAPRKR